MDTGHAFLRHPPIRWTVGVSPGEGAGEGTPSPSTKTILALPPGSRPGAGHVAVIAREGRKTGEVTQNTTSHRHLSIHHSPSSPTPGTPGIPPQIPLVRTGAYARPSPQARPKPSPGRLKSATSGGDPDQGDPAPTGSGFMKIPTIRTSPARYTDSSVKSETYRDLHIPAR